ncbi:Gfo/Idh/MocA family protein [Ruegeria sp. HKCCD8929]|uniref:Gfo/Idh/MocA family protein n=1 Tax=Ruegeria sp. HKCCD8929 TaxID=2683006 RepID=UPI0014879A67|nr:Gfo/Idh/MocA family oxidoreductase [Ruegeria sp. HKCCD8929]
MLNVAILGCGIGGEHISGYAQLADRYRIAVICDTNQQLAQKYATTTGARATTDIDDVLADPGVDIVDICLPPSMHVPVAIRAVNAGKHAIVEKPLAGSLSDADRLVEAEIRSQQRVFPVFQYRYGRAFDQLRALRAAGLLGRPLAASIETHWSRDSDYYANPWRGTWERELGGAVLSHAIHAHDLLTQQFGPVADVSAMLTTRANPIETEDCAAISLRMVNGAVATSSITLGAATDTTRLRFVFAYLTAESGCAPYTPGQDQWQFIARETSVQSRVDEVVNNAPTAPEGFAGLFEAIADELEGREGREVTLAEGLASIELVSAIYQSDRSGEQVTLPVDRMLPIAASLRA